MRLVGPVRCTEANGIWSVQSRCSQLLVHRFQSLLLVRLHENKKKQATNLVSTVPLRSAIGTQVLVSNLGEEREKRPVLGLSS
jgi:hypothetical protein